MKKYIITNSLNIDNILSTESISPASFYENRNFGYKTFEQVKEFSKISPILLFSEIPSFEIIDDEREAYPMVIALDDEQQIKEAKEVGSYKNCTVYAYGKTIRLNPNNCEILFFSSKSMKLAQLNCHDSKYCKMADYFRMSIAHQGNVALADIVKNGIKSKSLKDVCLGDANEDNIYDKDKGFIWGYFIGATKSIEPNTARLLRIQKRAYDILASIKNNQGQINAAFRSELSNLNNKYKEYNPNTKSAADAYNKLIDDCGGKEKIDIFCKGIGLVEGEAKLRFGKTNGYSVPWLNSNFSCAEFESYYSEINNLTKSLIDADRKHIYDLLDIRKMLDFNTETYKVMMGRDNCNDNLFNKILDKIIWNGAIGDIENLRIHREDVATNVIQIVKDIVGGNWNGSKEQQYFHHLRENIGLAKPFNLHEIDNVIYQSLAAFLLKGEDFDELVKYLENNAASTYRYALALWGATTGYVKISRLITSALSGEQFNRLYKDAYTLMTGLQLNGELHYIESKPDNENLEEIESDMNAKGDKMELRDKVLETFDAMVGNKKREKLRQSLSDVCNSIHAKTYQEYIEKVLTSLRDCKKWAAKKQEPTYKKFKECLESSAGIVNNNIKKHVSMQSELVFTDNGNSSYTNYNTMHSRKSFLEDKNAWIKDCKKYVSSGAYEFTNQSTWFVDNHRIGGQYEQNINDPDSEKIEHFRRYLLGKKNYFSLDIDGIINYLNERYANR